jgi:hypothetical protein
MGIDTRNHACTVPPSWMQASLLVMVLVRDMIE